MRVVSVVKNFETSLKSDVPSDLILMAVIQTAVLPVDKHIFAYYQPGLRLLSDWPITRIGLENKIHSYIHVGSILKLWQTLILLTFEVL